jgi:uncharacterized cupredoxin-like copper-binding protein
MTVYFVIGAVLIVWALVLTFGGMARIKSFPDRNQGRVLMAVSAGLSVVVFAAVVASTHKEHPKEEAEEKAAEERAAGEQPSGEAGERPSATEIVVTEDEYSIKLAGGNRLTPGILTFNVANRGKIPHDLAIQGSGGSDKTPLIDPGKRGRLQIELVPGPYRFYCSVPGHEQLGMKTAVTVRKP